MFWEKHRVEVHDISETLVRLKLNIQSQISPNPLRISLRIHTQSWSYLIPPPLLYCPNFECNVISEWKVELKFDKISELLRNNLTHHFQSCFSPNRLGIRGNCLYKICIPKCTLHFLYSKFFLHNSVFGRKSPLKPVG